MLRTAAADRLTSVVRVRVALAAAIAMAAIGVIVLGFQMWVDGTTRLLAAVRFEVRLAEDRPIPGMVVAQLGDSGRLIYLHPESVVSNDDIAQSWVLQDDQGRYGVSVQFRPAGAERMRQATAAHVGRPVAILIDGAAVMAPVLRSPISDSAVISGNYTRAEAERIADGIGRR
jgi:hypothetical protein